MLLLNYGTAWNLHVLGIDSIKSQRSEADNMELGVGINALPSIISQSCLPNSFFLFRDRSLVTVAGRPIKKGEEVSTSKSTFLPVYSRAI